MDIMLERILELIGDKHGAAKELAEHLGTSSNRITDWKAGRVKSYPKYASRIADYYDVSLDWLSGNTDQKEKPLVNNDEELTEYLEELKNRPETRMLFKLAKGATKEDVQQAVKIIEALRKE